MPNGIHHIDQHEWVLVFNANNKISSILSDRDIFYRYRYMAIHQIDQPPGSIRAFTIFDNLSLNYILFGEGNDHSPCPYPTGVVEHVFIIERKAQFDDARKNDE